MIGIPGIGGMDSRHKSVVNPYRDIKEKISDIEKSYMIKYIVIALVVAFIIRKVS